MEHTSTDRETKMLTSEHDPMHLCPKIDKIFEFCQRQPVRYRHMLAELKPRDPALSVAWCEFYGMMPITQSIFYADSCDNIGLLAAYRRNRLRIEGELGSVTPACLQDWCQRLNPVGVATTSEPIRDLLCQTFGRNGWNINFHYATTAERFQAVASHNIRCLSLNDSEAFKRFVERPGDTPFLSIQHAHPAFVRDFEFLKAGYPVLCYAAFAEDEIVGLLTTNPFSDFCVEISRLHVLSDYRKQGIARSLISAFTQETLDSGCKPVLAISGEFKRMERLVAPLGYEVASPFWHKRYWTDLPTKSVSL